MEDELVDLLNADPAIGALVAGRIHWNLLPQGVSKPAVALSLISRTPQYVMGGESSIRSARVQVDVWAKTYASSLAVSRAITAKLSGFSGEQAGVTFEGIFMLSEDQSIEDAGVDKLHRVRLDFAVNYSA